MKFLAQIVLGLGLVSCAQYGTWNAAVPTETSKNIQTEDALSSSEATVEADEPSVSTSSVSLPDTSTRPMSLPENERALADCVKQWPNLPEAPLLAKKAQVIELNAFVSDDLVFEDSRQTDQPVMYLLNLNFDIPKQGRMQLRNKKGWYCVAIRTRTVQVFEIGVACETTIATATTERQIFDRFNITRDNDCN